MVKIKIKQSGFHLLLLASIVGSYIPVHADVTDVRAIEIESGSETCSAEEFQKCARCYETSYNCSLPGLGRFVPGIYSGVKVNYLSFVTSTSSPNFPVRAKEFEACTGGQISFAEAQNVWEDPIKDLGTQTSKGTEFYDGYFMSYSHFPEASALDLAEHLNERVRDDNDRLKWEDVLPKVRAMGEYRKDGVTNLDFLMYDGDFFVPIIRLDLLEQYQFSIPNTWEEVVEIAKFFNGTDLNGDGDAEDFGFCHFPRLGAGYWDWWWPEALYSTWATMSQTEGMDQGFFFDEESMEPRIDAGFGRAAEIWKELWQNGADGCITNHFTTGRCAIGFAPPGCWKGVFLDPDGVNRKDENGNVIWKPTMKSGDYAEPYRFKPFGSTMKVNRTTDKLVKCTEQSCPKAEPAPERGHHGVDDRASILPKSSVSGELINRAPFYWSGGLGTLIRKSAAPRKKDLLWDFFVYTNSPETSVYDVANYASWLDSWRYSQLSPGQNFLDAGWSQDAYKEHSSVMEWALSEEVNGALNLRIPGLARYTRDVIGGRMGKYIAGEMTLETLMKEVSDEWTKVTDDEGRLKQLEIYRAALRKDELSDIELCRLHRDLMDELRPQVCLDLDPSITNANNDTAMIATLSIVLSLASLFIVAFGAWWFLRTKADSVWLVKTSELRFDDPAEILGRGSFGLVLLAEYRGTQVAVKRVIPPKVGKQHKSELKTKLFGWGDGESSLFVDKMSSAFDGSFDFELDLSDQVIEAALPQPPKEFAHDDVESAMKTTDHEGIQSTKKNVKRGGATGFRRLSWNESLQTTIMLEDEPDLTVGNTTDEANEKRTTRRASINKSRRRRSLGLVSGGLVNVNIDELSRKSSTESLRMKSSKSEERGYSIKSVQKLFGRRDEYERLKSDFVVEMRQLSSLRHPCITTVMGAVISKKEEPLLVMEYMDHGSLYDLLHNETMTIEGEVVLPILRDIAQGVRFLHASSPQVIHGDLKAQNILVDSKFRAKVADFGLSQKKQVGGTGTPFWMAPELLRRESINTSASDVYSFGIILYELYSREEPYEGEDFQDVIRQVCDPKINKRPPRPPNMPAEVASFFMNNCLLASPEERPSFDDLDLVLKRFQVANVEPGKEVSSIQENKILAREAIAKRNASLLYEVFPKKVADALSAGRKVEPEHFSCVTIFFTDIVGFTTICHSMSVSKVSDMLDRLYLKFDDLSREHDVFKLETIGDAWMGVTNLSTEQLDHTKRIAEFAIAAISVAAETLIDSERPELGVVQIRAGFHSGPVLANVVGSRAPKYTLFGDTVNTSSRMESTSLPGHIQCSDRAAGLLREQAPDISLKYRGEIKVKGKGDMHTYWLLAKNQGTPAFDKEQDSFIPDIFIDEINRSR